MDVVCLGELLVDLIGQQTGDIRAVTTFNKYPGGSAANVAVGLARLGLSTGIVTRLGQDPFGDFLTDTMREHGVDTTQITRDKRRRTSLAFVSLDGDKVPDYVFYRHPSASMYLGPSDIDRRYIANARLLYTSSMSIVNRPFRDAIFLASRIAHRAGALVSFDVNLRLDLWRTTDEARRQIMAFLKVVDILKIAQHELDFVYPRPNGALRWGSEAQLGRLFRDRPNLSLVTLTLGEAGSLCMLGPDLGVEVPAIRVDPGRIVDTTGAGDAYMAALLACLVWKMQEETQFSLEPEEIRRFAQFANKAAALTIQKPGVIPALPTKAEIGALR